MGPYGAHGPVAEWRLRRLEDGRYEYTFMTRKITRLAKEHGARFEYLFMRTDGERLQHLAGLLEQGVIKPIVDKTFPLEKIREALDYTQSGRAVEKIVITND